MCPLDFPWYVYLSVLPALFHFVSLFMFLSFSLFHLEGYRTRLDDQPVSGMPSYFESQHSSSTFRELSFQSTFISSKRMIRYRCTSKYCSVMFFSSVTTSA